LLLAGSLWGREGIVAYERTYLLSIDDEILLPVDLNL
jgi:hypothetical protein